MPQEYTRYDRKSIFERDNYTCRYCGEPATEVDHVIPRSHGGNHDESNLVACCHRCNSTACSGRFENFEAKRTWVLSRRMLRQQRKAARGEVEVDNIPVGAPIKKVAAERNVPIWVVYRDRAIARKKRRR